MTQETRDAPAGLRLAHPPWSPRAAIGLVTVALALIGGWWLVDALWLADPPPPDVAGHEAFVEARTPMLVSVATAVTRLGDLSVVAVIGAALAGLARWREGRWDLAVLIVTVVVGVLAVTNVVKELTDRTRPDGALVDVLALAFPSGHASRAAAVCAIAGWLAWRLARSRLLRVSAVALAVATAAAVGVSRLVLGVHWPTDVLGGWLLGGLWTLAALRLTRPREGPAQD